MDDRGQHSIVHVLDHDLLDLLFQHAEPKAGFLVAGLPLSPGGTF